MWPNSQPAVILSRQPTNQSTHFLTYCVQSLLCIPAGKPPCGPISISSFEREFSESSSKDWKSTVHVLDKHGNAIMKLQVSCKLRAPLEPGFGMQAASFWEPRPGRLPMEPGQSSSGRSTIIAAAACL